MGKDIKIKLNVMVYLILIIYLSTQIKAHSYNGNSIGIYKNKKDCLKKCIDSGYSCIDIGT